MTLKVNEPNAQVEAMSGDWSMVDDLLGGTRAMRMAGSKYLPKRAMEDVTDHLARIANNVLLPAFGETCVKLTGRVFSEPMLLNDNVPEWIRGSGEDQKGGIADDIDLQGNNVQVFARTLFFNAIAYGLTHVLVEAPVKPATVQTKADENQVDLRPYLIHICEDRVVGWKQDQNGQLAQLRIKFDRTEPDGDFGEKVIPQIKVFEPGKVDTYEERTSNGATTWVLVETVNTGLDKIPFATFYTKRTGFMMAEPPLRELAFLNIKHWRQQSSHDELLETAEVPILVAVGADLDKKVAIGSKVAISMPMDSDLKYVEHTGKALESGEKALDRLKQDMRDAGAKLLQPGTGRAGSISTSSGVNNRTAADVNETAASDNSALGTMTHDYEDFWEQVLDLLAMYRSESDGGSVECQPNLDPDFSPVDTLTYLQAMADRGRLSDQTLFAETQKRGMIGEDITWPEEQARIKAQAPKPSATPPAPINPRPAPRPPAAA